MNIAVNFCRWLILGSLISSFFASFWNELVLHYEYQIFWWDTHTFYATGLILTPIVFDSLDLSLWIKFTQKKPQKPIFPIFEYRKNNDFEHLKSKPNRCRNQIIDKINKIVTLWSYFIDLLFKSFIHLFHIFIFIFHKFTAQNSPLNCLEIEKCVQTNE